MWSCLLEERILIASPCVVVAPSLCGEVTAGFQGAMRFTEQRARNQYANMVVHTLIPPQEVYDLAADLASRMRQLTNNRQ